MARTLTGEDADLVAVVVWEHPLTRNGVTKPAREWLTGSHDFAAQSRDQTIDPSGITATTWAHWATDWATKAVNILEAPPEPPA